ncbi:ankyrin repeat-containing domain protein [Flagelloscypha sp. PMI_526]|nr:ankyrin repeat-containing domain protein [Flagelloscypha sp. PMI_526]
MTSLDGEVCIPPDPDISGIGVRTAIYVQTFLSLAPSIWAVLDKRVTEFELDSVENQSTTILITAFAVLLSTIVQAQKQGISNFHGLVILNLTWMNNTNTFVYFLLYIHHRARDGERWQDWKFWAKKFRGGSLPKSRQLLGFMVEKVFSKSVFVLGSIHLSLMSGVGVWLWSRPQSFSASKPCSMDALFFILGKGIPLRSPGLRIFSLVIYGAFLVPGINLLVPGIVILAVYILYNRGRELPSITPIAFFLALFGLMNVTFIINIELMLATLSHDVNLRGPQDEELDWTFGQTLALLMILVPLRDTVDMFFEQRNGRHRRDLTDALLENIEKRDLPPCLELIEKGADPNAQIDLSRNRPFTTTLQMAVQYADLATVWKLVLVNGADVNIDGGSCGTPLMLACKKQNVKMVEFLIEQGALVNPPSTGLFGSPLQTIAGTKGPVALEIATYLINKGADVNACKGDDGGALHAACFNGNFQMAVLLCDHGADVNLICDTNIFISTTPFFNACVSRPGYLDVMELLVERDADINLGGAIRCLFGISQAAILEFLADHGAVLPDLSSTTEENIQLAIRAFGVAADEGSVKGVEYLCNARLNVHARTNVHQWSTPFSGSHALQIASYRGHLDVINVLLARGSDVNFQYPDEVYGNALNAALRGKQWNLVKPLVDAGAFVDRPSKQDWDSTSGEDAFAIVEGQFDGPPDEKDAILSYMRKHGARGGSNKLGPSAASSRTYGNCPPSFVKS